MKPREGKHETQSERENMKPQEGKHETRESSLLGIALLLSLAVAHANHEPTSAKTSNQKYNTVLCFELFSARFVLIYVRAVLKCLFMI